MTTRSRNTKRVLRVLLFVGGFLVLALIAAVIYFYAIGEFQQAEEEKEQYTCGCYIIDPAVVNDCGDPKKAVLFNTNTAPADGVCNAKCETELLSQYILKSSTEIDRYKSCSVRSIADARCQSMILTDQDGKLITGRVDPGDSIKIEATFDKDEYTNHVFTINSETQEPDSNEGTKIIKTITDFSSSDSLEIVASATDSQGNNINSIICRRVVEVQKEGGIGANAISASTERQSDGTTKISQIIVSVGQLTSENIKLSFSFGNNYPILVMEDGFNVEASKGTVTISKANLYETTNFSSAQSFSVLDQHTGDLEITAEIFVDELSIGNVSTEVNFVKQEDPIVEEPTEQEEDTSNFTTSKTVAPQCVERVEGSNVATFTIAVRNSAQQEEGITYIKDKLPLGFVYVTGSSVINGTSVQDSEMVNITTVGSTQEIVWQRETAWDIAPEGQLIVVFQATAGTEALTGENMNEVIVNPVKIPSDPATLRAEAVIQVEQDCDNPSEQPTTPTTPSTGIFDNVIVRIIVGIVLFATAWFVYTRPEGSKLSEMILNSGIYKDAQLTKYKLTNPKKYFEEKIIREKK